MFLHKKVKYSFTFVRGVAKYCIISVPPAKASWARLYETGAGQEGYFTTRQAKEAGVSAQLLNHYLHSGRVSRAHRGVYRLTQFPPGDHEDLTVVWLWTAHAGVFSHETALALLDLSDVLPSRIHVSVPIKESARRRIVPANVILYFADVPSTDRTWPANVPSTTAKRTLLDCAMGGVSPEFVMAASEQAVRRGLVERRDLAEVERSLLPYRSPP